MTSKTVRFNAFAILSISLLMLSAPQLLAADDTAETRAAKKLIEDEAASIFFFAHPTGTFKSAKFESIRKDGKEFIVSYTFTWVNIFDKTLTPTFAFTFDSDGVYKDCKRTKAGGGVFPCFVAADLSEPIDLAKTFDLVQSLEVAEHIAAAEDFLYGRAEEDMKSPARPAGEDVKAIDDFILAGVPDRSHKAQAPEPLKPTNRFGSPEGSLKHFAESRAKTEAFINDGKGLRDHAAPGPMDKKFDPYQWVLFLAAHSERHTKQILEVKADPNFPKS